MADADTVSAGLVLATAAAAVGAVACAVKGISQRYAGGRRTGTWVLGFVIGMWEAVFDSWSLAGMLTQGGQGGRLPPLA
jgi:hypothetical protein